MTDEGLHVRALLTGYPRIGPRRELKWLLERAWRAGADRSTLLDELGAIKRAHLAEQEELTGSSLDDFWIYDQVLETALSFGLVPEALRGGDDGASRLAADPFAVLTDLARGTPERPAWEMTKWFDTNYHYVVPVGDGSRPRLAPPPWRTPTAERPWNVLGAVSLARLGRLENLDVASITRQYASLAASVGVPLVIDEPWLSLELDESDLELLGTAYEGWDASVPAIVTAQLGTPGDAAIAVLAERGLAVQVNAADVPRIAATDAWRRMPEHVIGVVDGRSPWPDAAGPLAATLPSLGDRPVTLVPTISLSFLPYTVVGEPELERLGFTFAREKARILAGWAADLAAGRAPREPEVSPPVAEWAQPPDAVEARSPREERKARQPQHPPLPTTTIGSFPQTDEVRRLRRQLNAGEIDQGEYTRRIDAAIVDAVRWQDDAGLDVLVHGEFERTDMVEYFAERLDGFLTTHNGWVVSYGSRCTRPPILMAPPRAAGPITVREWKVAQEATTKPVKGMLTGPVTIVNWSFRPPGVPDAALFWGVGQAIAAEVRELVDAGARVVQVDEPAVRERWPLRRPGWQEARAAYRSGANRALQLVFAQAPEVQMHTHMCYGDFTDIVDAWREVGVDVASIEFTRSQDEGYIAAFAELGWEIGPGVFDVHSPHRPGADGVAERLRRGLAHLPRERLWVNPDCGLKTRRWPEVEAQVADLLAGAAEVRG
jgi:5-methyltetrahydropteroyltriglutamate--homocysteine methyltransferase